MGEAKEKEKLPRERNMKLRDSLSRAHNFPRAEMELFIGGPLLTRTDNRPPVATGDRRRCWR